MTGPLERDALRVVQDVVRDATGKELPTEARQRLERLLRAIAKGSLPPAEGQAFSQREVTILFADLRGFSGIVSAYPTEVVLGVLDRCFVRMTEIIVRHYGTIDKFIGDAIMVIFPGDATAPRDHARRALLCAVEMQMAMSELRSPRQERQPDLYMGIGISTGTVMAGLIGAEEHRAFTIIGEEVNIAARIEALSLRGQVLMSEATYEHCRDFVHVGEPMEVHVKGRSQRMLVREALGIPDLGKIVPRQDVRKSPRVQVRLPLEYWPVEGKTVAPEAVPGIVRDLGYHGALVELERAQPLRAEIKIAFDLSFLGSRAVDVYGRVVSVRAEGGRFLHGVEFTSLEAETQDKIELFVQMLLQGDYHALE
jgi:adenylate cyclase